MAEELKKSLEEDGESIKNDSEKNFYSKEKETETVQKMDDEQLEDVSGGLQPHNPTEAEVRRRQQMGYPY
ncbi:MAG: hypothetical protein ACI4HI_07775 [Lachnospiraceae bacterium]